MQTERWYWLWVFCIASLLIHLMVLLQTYRAGSAGTGKSLGSIEVTLTPVAPPKTIAISSPIPPKSIGVVPKPAAPKKTIADRGIPTMIKTAPLPKGRIEADLRQPTRPAKTVALNKPTPKAPSLPDPLLNEAPTSYESRVALRSAPPRLRLPRQDRVFNPGGGSEAPSEGFGGNRGSSGADAPKEEVIYNRGGRGDDKLPTGTPRIGGGGGKSILSVSSNNPLADAVPEELPGQGRGSGGGSGTGRGGGSGFASGIGIGAKSRAGSAISMLRKKAGTGIGAAETGDNTGTAPPATGRGSGSETPGTGGSGTGYGRGRGRSIGDGTDEDPRPTKNTASALTESANPLGDVDGDPVKNVPGRGGVFGSQPSGGGEGAIHIVYVMDVSGSMRDGNKIGKAKEALKRALSELRRNDTFNIVLFKKDVKTFRDDMTPATVTNIANARNFIDNILMGDGTNVSQAVDIAFGMNGLTHVFLISDGDPNGGIEDFAELRKFVKDKNTRKAKIQTLALGLGEKYTGMELLRGIANDNNGTFDYVNMNQIASPNN